MLFKQKLTSFNNLINNYFVALRGITPPPLPPCIKYVRNSNLKVRIIRHERANPQDSGWDYCTKGQETETTNPKT